MEFVSTELVFVKKDFMETIVHCRLMINHAHTTAPMTTAAAEL